MCLARALVIAVAHDRWNTLPEGVEKRRAKTVYDRLRKSVEKHQRIKAQRLHGLAGVPTDRPCSLLDIPHFERALNVEVDVISCAHNNATIYRSSKSYPKRMYLYLVKDSPDEEIGHFHCIVNITGFLSTSYYCEQCRKAYSHKTRHSCQATCAVCCSNNCELDEASKRVCPDCNMKCRSEACFRSHKEDTKFTSGKRKDEVRAPAMCTVIWKCPECYSVIEKSRRPIESHK